MKNEKNNSYNIYQGTQKQILTQEKLMINAYFINNGHLPPGNRIFR